LHREVRIEIVVLLLDQEIEGRILRIRRKVWGLHWRHRVRCLVPSMKR